MPAPNQFFKLVGPLQERFGDHFRYTVAVIREDSIALFTRTRNTKRAAASRCRNGEILRGGVRLATWKEFHALLGELIARMQLDGSVLDGVDLTNIKGNLFVRKSGGS